MSVIALNALSIILLALVVATFLLPFAKRFRAWRDGRFKEAREEIERWTPIAAAVLALSLTCWTFRVQAQQSAENALNTDGEMFVNAEYADPMLRCLYTWHAYDDPVLCRDTIISNRENYTKTMLYIEEVFFLLEKAKEDRATWGASYAEDIRYWASDVAADPTSMFSYQAVVENPDDPVGAMKRAGVDVKLEDVCRKYREVVAALAAKGAKPEPLKVCA